GGYSAGLLSFSVRFFATASQHIQIYRQIVEERPRQNQQVEQFVEGPLCRDVWLLDGVEHRSHRVADPAQSHQRQAGLAQSGEVLCHKHHRPSHDEIYCRGQHPWCVDPQHLRQHPRQGHAPEDQAELCSPGLGQQHHAEGRVAAGNQHIDHTVVHFPQHPLHSAAGGSAGIVVIDGAGGIQCRHRQTEAQGRRHRRYGRIRPDAPKQIQQTAPQGGHRAERMGFTADGVLGLCKQFAHGMV
ncbi:N-acetylmuramoyl-L-alanine amidase AmiA, partial [Dysosmobacter welbionis]